MNKRFLAFCAGLALLALAASDSVASWADIPLEQVVGGSRVVVIGAIESIKPADPPKQGNEYQFDTAYITVSDVLKNTLPDLKIAVGDKIPLSMPSASNRMMMSTDIRYKVGTNGIWILKWKDQTFWATYPKDLQPLSKEKEIRDIIQKLK